MLKKVILPKQGLQMTEGYITKWFVKEGEEVREGQPLFEMETDKLVITIDASCSGTLLKVVRSEGERVPITETIGFIGDVGENIPDILPNENDNCTSEIPIELAATIISDAYEPVVSASLLNEETNVSVLIQGRIFVTPRAKALAEEKGYPLAKIFSSGPEGLIIERDVFSYALQKESETTADKLAVSSTAFMVIYADFTRLLKLEEERQAFYKGTSINEIAQKCVSAALKRSNEWKKLTLEDFDISFLGDKDIEFYYAVSTKYPAIGFGRIGENKFANVSITYNARSITAMEAAEFMSCLKILIETPIMAYL